MNGELTRRKRFVVTVDDPGGLIQDVESGEVQVRDHDPNSMEGENYDGHRPV